IATAAFCVLTFSAAQADSQEIVVTGSRIPEYSGVPHVALPHRADFVLRELKVDCDTRDKAQRINEIKATLRSLMSAAASHQIVLGLRSASGDDEFVLPLTEDRFDSNILDEGNRADSSYTTLLVKSAVGGGETSERPANARIESFVHGVNGV